MNPLSPESPPTAPTEPIKNQNSKIENPIPLRTQLHVEVRTPAPVAPVPSPGAPSEPSASSLTSLSSVKSSSPVLDFISSDSTLDRYQEIIDPAGWRLDNYRQNPVFQNAHQYGDILFTLGKALITEVRSATDAAHHSPLSSLPSSYLFQRIEFATAANPMARIAHALYSGGFLNTVSVGFIPLRWLDETGTEHVSKSRASAPAHVSLSACQHVSVSSCHPPTQLRTRQFRRKYLEQELLEVSAVAIPANPNALALALKSGAVDRSDLAETLDLLRSTLDRAPRTADIVAVRQDSAVSPTPSRHPSAAPAPSSDQFQLSTFNFQLSPPAFNFQLFAAARQLARLLRL